MIWVNMRNVKEGKCETFSEFMSPTDRVAQLYLQALAVHLFVSYEPYKHILNRLPHEAVEKSCAIFNPDPSVRWRRWCYTTIQHYTHTHPPIHTITHWYIGGLEIQCVGISIAPKTLPQLIAPNAGSRSLCLGSDLAVMPKIERERTCVCVCVRMRRNRF